MENKNEGNENKIILRDSNCIKDKMGRCGGNKTQILYRGWSYYVLNVVRTWGSMKGEPRFSESPEFTHQRLF